MRVTIYFKDGRIEKFEVYSFGYGRLLRKNSREYFTMVTKPEQKFIKILASKVRDYTID